MSTMTELTIEATLNSKKASDVRRSALEAEMLLKDFAKEIGAITLPSDVEECVKKYIVEVILPIRWYAGRIAQAWRWRLWYLVVTAGLIVAVPVGIALLPMALSKTIGSNTPATVVAQLTAVLTGVVALQKTLGGWMGQHQRYAAWWKVSSDLKKLWYGLQTKWAGMRIGEADLTDAEKTEIGQLDEKAKAERLAKKIKDKQGALKNDLNKQIEQARALIADEEYEFFKGLTIPTTDILDVLKTSQASVTGFVTAVMPGAARADALAKAADTYVVAELKAQQDIASKAAMAKHDLRKHNSVLKTLEADITRLSNEVAGAPTEAKEARKTELAALIKKRGDTLQAKADAEAVIAAS